jgi:positive regulator of sigma E activity
MSLILLIVLLILLFPLGGWHLLMYLAAALANPLGFLIHDMIMILGALLLYHLGLVLIDRWNVSHPAQPPRPPAQLS